MLQLSARNIIMLVASIVALFFSVFFIVKFPQYYFVYPVIGLILEYILVLFSNKEVAVFFILPYFFSGFVLLEFTPETSRAKIMLAVLAVSVSAIIVFIRARSGEKSLNEKNRHTAKLEKLFNELSLENSEWEKSYRDAFEQASFQNTLLSMVKRILEVLEVNEVKHRLSQLLAEAFPNMSYTIKSVGGGSDIFDHWVYQRKVPLLIKDINSDSRFPVPPKQLAWSSLLAAPILIQKEVYEIVRLESRAKEAFHMSHLRVIELLSLMTSIAIDNISLLGVFREKAVHDGFTGLINHKYFIERLEQELLYAGRYKHSLGVIMIDIDHFKIFNDTYGHLAGDEVIKRLVKVILSKVRSVDIVARYGGEEFSVLLPEVSSEELYCSAEAIRAAFSEERFEFGGSQCSATISAGIAVFPKDAATPAQLVRWADQRLYSAKTQGRNRVVG